MKWNANIIWRQQPHGGHRKPFCMNSAPSPLRQGKDLRGAFYRR